MSGTLCHAGLVVFCAQWLTLEVCYEILYKLTFDISQIYKHSLIGSCDKDSLLLCNAIQKHPPVPQTLGLSRTNARATDNTESIAMKLYKL